MSLQVELFRGDNYVRYGEIALMPLLQAFFEPLIGEPLADAYFYIILLPPDDPAALGGLPSVVNLQSSHGYVQVCVVRRGELIYQHPHPVREIIGAQLQEILAKREPAEGHWGFQIRGHDLDRITSGESAMEITHIDARTRRKARFHLEEVGEPEPPEASLADLGANVAAYDFGADSNPPVTVVIGATLRHEFLLRTPFSAEVEEGGFLAGRVFRDRKRADGFIVEITGAIRAEQTGASMLSFTFTGESFLKIGEQISARERDEQLLGWYHTHLFGATDALGLSSVDVKLHRSTFRRPWQVAALINLAKGNRTLRFYCADGETMALVPYWEVRR